MINYPNRITKSGLTIYDIINPSNSYLYIPGYALERILSEALTGLSLSGLPLRTRSKFVKQEICAALGYPVPNTFAKTRPRFPGQNFDVYIQKSMNLQIWNEEIDVNRRYVFLKINDDDCITKIKVITGNNLIAFDRTGKLTTKYQATMVSYGTSQLLSNVDTTTVSDFIIEPSETLMEVRPNYYPNGRQLLRIAEVYRRLLPIAGQTIEYLDAVQERNRGAELHAMICHYLGYSNYEDDGEYPDLANQLLEIKLQTSPTIDLGLHSPEDNEPIVTIGNTIFHSEDIRYAIFEGEVHDHKVFLKALYLVSGQDFTNYFPLFKGKGKNAKIQIPLPHDFFED